MLQARAEESAGLTLPTTMTTVHSRDSTHSLMWSLFFPFPVGPASSAHNRPRKPSAWAKLYIMERNNYYTSSASRLSPFLSSVYPQSVVHFGLIQIPPCGTEYSQVPCVLACLEPEIAHCCVGMNFQSRTWIIVSDFFR